MAPPLEAADRSLIKILLQEGFKTQDIVSVVKCSPRTVQRIHREKEQPDMPRRKARPGRRSCITPPMKKAIYDMLIEDAELYNEELLELILDKLNSVKVCRKARSVVP